MFKWIVNLFKKKETPVEQRLRLTEQQLREIGEQAVREVAAKKIVTNMIEENRRERQAVKTAPSSNAKPLDAQALRRRVAQRKAGMEPSRVSSQNTPSRRYDDDDNLLTTAIIASQVYSSQVHHSSSSSHTYSSHDDGGSYSSGSCDSGGGGGGCD